ncbi:hypothetical protein CLUG_00244 [Clavispora lusitaniae ATCC 42720]|uniref:Fork-head domain-containing protein n=1 Tax=Clavispora lusitaniae (strain ATCC 42720) TaxID=306902 RepID=C4XWC1_CLAL4|nr:uncharacterized protein CLUG_00244 [Clavispora lusitaniae ATCC 42720]EEQ36121.1 hypothetical protein CLUG_00244 [Clavispora lusitaniae ATCC 42720]KAF5213341.1 hypothetical protein E0198_000858 [Clavispora lusitaniae]
MSRKPLFSQNLNVPISAAETVAETPATHLSTKITTPPHSVYAKRNHSVLDTPVRTSDASSAARSLLMSPAFSSPQQQQPPVFQNPSSLMKSPRCMAPAFSETAPFSAPAVSGLECAPVLEDGKKKRPKKTKRDAREGFSLDSNEKPPYSYATLIGMSILTHPDKQLTLSQIYTWISETFKYYRREDVGWQNSIRHNLSLNKAFVKGAKSKDGKGHFWCIKPECEDLFLKAKNNKKSSYHEVMDQLATARQQAISMLPSSPPPQAHDERKRPSDTEGENPSKRSRISTDYESDSTGPDFDSSLLRTPAPALVVSESPAPLLAGKHLTFASSFSCSSNFELSPVQPLETGPLLEPLPPQNGAFSQSLPAITLNRVVSQHLPQLQPPIPTFTTPRSGVARTPKSGAKTPLRTLRTPSSGTVMRKLWHSPSYLEEFYYSPFGNTRAVLNSYDDDDMLMRAFDSPRAPGRASLLHELRKADSDPAEETDVDQTG